MRLQPSIFKREIQTYIHTYSQVKEFFFHQVPFSLYSNYLLVSIFNIIMSFTFTIYNYIHILELRVFLLSFVFVCEDEKYNTG